MTLVTRQEMAARKAPVKPPCWCGAPSVKRGLCSRHYQAQRLGRAPNHQTPLCALEGCSRPHHARGWCSLHYQRWKAHGDPEWVCQRYSYRARVKPRVPEPSIITAVRLRPETRARAEYAAALAGLPLATHLRHVIEAAHDVPLRPGVPGDGDPGDGPLAAVGSLQG